MKPLGGITVPDPENTYRMEGHYFCSKCHKLIGFPHPRGKPGVWHWRKRGNKLGLEQVHHKCC